MTFAAVLAWMKENPWPAVFLVVLWTLVNVAPRPHPEALTGWKKVFWTVVDRLSILTAAALPGEFKWLFQPSPSLGPKPSDGTAEKDKPS
jgi:hypothetical protein